MRKKLLTAVMIIMIITTVKSQETKFSIKAGANLSNLSVSAYGLSFTAEPIFSFNAGFFMEQQLSGINENLYGEIGIAYVGNGAEVTYPNVNSRRYNYKTNKFNIGQINLPISVKYKFADFLFLKGGFYWGIIVSGKVEDKDEGEIFNNYEDYKKMDGGLSIGLEFELPSGLLFDAGYYSSLLNISKEKNIKLKNRFFQIGIGLKF